MKTAFVGAVEGSARALRALIDAGRPPALVVTLPPEAAGRHSDYADLAPLARAAGADLHLTRDINAAETRAALTALAPDLLLIIGWSQICRAEVMAVPRLGVVGFHPAPLPQLRGRAAIPWTILAGLDRTAATLFWIDEGCDSGDIVLQRSFAVATDETARSLYDKHIETLAEMLPEAIERIARGEECRQPQDHSQASYCARRRAEDGRIDWSRPAEELALLIRAVGAPYPGAFTEYDGHRLVIDGARVHNGPPGYIGLPGQIQDFDGDRMWVSCGGFSCLEVTDWHMTGEATRPPRHALLGRRAEVPA